MEIIDADLADEVAICADVQGIPDGEEASVTIFEYNEGMNHDFVVKLSGIVLNGKLEVPWEVDFDRNQQNTQCARELQENEFTFPQYVFRLDYQDKGNYQNNRNYQTESALSKPLAAWDWIYKRLVYEGTEEALAFQKYSLLLDNDTQREGRTDRLGYITEKKLPVGMVQFYLQNDDANYSRPSLLPSDDEGFDPLLLALFRAIADENLQKVEDCITNGVDVNAFLEGETALVYTLRKFAYEFAYEKISMEIIRSLLKAGADPNIVCELKKKESYYDFLPARKTRETALGLTSREPALTQLLLEYGANPNIMVSDGASILMRYIYTVSAGYYGDYKRAIEYGSAPSYGAKVEGLLVESIEVLLKNGANPNASADGYTPLMLAFLKGIPDIADLLLKYGAVPSPHTVRRDSGFQLSTKESLYYKEKIQPQWVSDYLLLIHYGYDEIVLSCIEKDKNVLKIKDPDGLDLFDYAATYGSPDLMTRLLPQLTADSAGDKTRIINSHYADEKSLHLAALKNGNMKTAEVLYKNGTHTYQMEDAAGNAYSQEYLFYDRDSISADAEQVYEGGLYRYSQDGSTTAELYEGYKSGDYDNRWSRGDVIYHPNAYYILSTWGDEDANLYTTDGKKHNLDSLINASRDAYYTDKADKKPNEGIPRWHIVREYGDIFVAANRFYHDERNHEFALLHRNGTAIAAYILDTADIQIEAWQSLYSAYTGIDIFDDALDFVRSGNHAYLIKKNGEVYVFALDTHSATLEKIVGYKDCIISGMEGSERVFVSGDSVVAYNFATGEEHLLGTQVEFPFDHNDGGNYLYADSAGKRYIAEANSATIFPEPADEYHDFAVFDKGYIYTNESDPGDGYLWIVCIFDDKSGALRRKLILSGTAVDGSFAIYNGKIYIGAYLFGCIIDLETTAVRKAFLCGHSGRNADIYVYPFPFGADDMVYTYTIDYGK